VVDRQLVSNTPDSIGFALEIYVGLLSFCDSLKGFVPSLQGNLTGTDVQLIGPFTCHVSVPPTSEVDDTIFEDRGVSKLDGHFN
jgi:hypothetical protein